MRVWVTRTRPGADRTAERVRALGHDPVVAPVLETRDRPWAGDLTGVAALAFTSANGVAAFARATAARDRPAFAVGGATAQAAWEVGFVDVRSADGDVDALSGLIAGTAPFAGEVLHVVGRPQAGDLVGALARAGVPARALILYETTALDGPPPPSLGAVLVHSPHAGRILAARAPDDAALGSARILCISEAAAAPLRLAGFDRVVTAAHPDEHALLALLDP